MRPARRCDRGVHSGAEPLRAQRGPAVRRSGLRGPGPGAGGAWTPTVPAPSPPRSTPPTRRCTGTPSRLDQAGTTSGSSGSTCGSPASARSAGPTSPPPPTATGTPSGPSPGAGASCSTRRWTTSPSTGAPDLAPGDVLQGPAILEEFGSTVPLHPGFEARVDPYSNLLLTTSVRFSRQNGGNTTSAQRSRSVDPVLVEIVQGTLASVEREVETAIGRTSRSPDDPRRARLQGGNPRRPHAQADRPLVQRARPPRRPRPPDRRPCGPATCSSTTTSTPPRGASGTCPTSASPCRCSPRPGWRPAVVAFVQAFGHHDDIGGAVPGSMPSTATSVFEEGLMVPPIKLWDQGRPNEAALKIMTRNSRTPDALAADLDAECSACLMGAAGSPSCSSATGAPRSRRASTRSCAAPPRRTGARSSRRSPTGLHVGGLRRARRHRPAEAARPADHADEDPGQAARPRLHRHRPAGEGSDQPRRRLRRREFLESGWRRSCATSPTPPSAWPSWTSTRASCSCSSCGSRRRARC